MLMLVALLVAAAMTCLIFDLLEREEAPFAAPAAPTDRGFALLSNGRLMYRQCGGRLTELEDGQAPDRPLFQHTTAAVYQAQGSLLYFVRDGDTGALFRRDTHSGRETLLLLQHGLHLTDLCISPDGSTVAATSHTATGATHIVLFQPDGTDFRALTSGDTVDCAPAWIPSAPGRLLYQSARLVRDGRGPVAARGPASLRLLNIATGADSSILAEADFDLLRPRVDPAGNLLFIRREYTGGYHLEDFVLDAVLVPFRLLRAVFERLRLHATTGQPRPEIVLHGHRINAEKAVRSEDPLHGIPSLVPHTWHLVRRSTQGDETVLATNVSSHDVGRDGTIVYSNGRGVFMLGGDGAARLALTTPLVTEVIAAA